MTYHDLPIGMHTNALTRLHANRSVLLQVRALEASLRELDIRVDGKTDDKVLGAQRRHGGGGGRGGRGEEGEGGEGGEGVALRRSSGGGWLAKQLGGKPLPGPGPGGVAAGKGSRPKPERENLARNNANHGLPMRHGSGAARGRIVRGTQQSGGGGGGGGGGRPAQPPPLSVSRWAGLKLLVVWVCSAGCLLAGWVCLLVLTLVAVPRSCELRGTAAWVHMATRASQMHACMVGRQHCTANCACVTCSAVGCGAVGL